MALETMLRLLIDREMTEGLQDKLDVFFALGRMGEELYIELTETIGSKGVEI